MTSSLHPARSHGGPTPRGARPVRPSPRLLALALASIAACGGNAFTQLPSNDAPDAAPPDGGAEAAAPFCFSHSGQFDFCSDFDETGLPESWSDVTRTGGGDIQEDSSASVSPARSVVATLPELLVPDAGARPTASALLTKPGLPKGATHIAFDFRIDAVNFPVPTDVQAVVLPASYQQGPTWSVSLALRASTAGPFDLWLIESVTVAGQTPTLTFHQFHGALADVGTWTHVKLDFDIDHAATLASVPGTLTIGAAAARAFTLSPPLGTANGARSLILGAAATAATGATRLRFDNVTYVSR